ncbi:MAG: hypothetical protein ACETWR_24895 [Anaerolineae bacterium]
MFTRIITSVAVVYTLLLGALSLWAREVALPTKGGISPSEVIEGFVSGGLNTLLLLWLLIFLATIGAWVATLAKENT